MEAADLSDAAHGRTAMNVGSAARALEIAIVDDDPLLRKSLSRLLRVSGFTVKTYESAEEFLARPAEDRPDCLVLDIHLPGMSGSDLALELVRRGVRTPIVFITALEERTTLELLNRGPRGFGYLLKPFDDTALIASIDRAIQSTPL